jgi:predicted nucleotidyltransferase
MQAEKQIQETADKIAGEFQPEKIILFGSWAWGKPGPDSDVDLFVVKDALNSRKLAGDIRGFLWGSLMPLDILVYKPDDIGKSLSKGNFFIRNIISQGKVLYER